MPTLRLREAKRDYDFGFTRPQEIGELEGVDYSALDKGNLPKELRSFLEERGAKLDKFKLSLQELQKRWILTAGKKQYLLKSHQGNVVIHDMESTESLKRPSYRDVAKWHDISYDYLRNQGGMEGWKVDRDARDQAIEAAETQELRRTALIDYKEMRQKHRERRDRMLQEYDAAMEDGKIPITTRDAISAMGQEAAETKTMIDLDKNRGDRAGNFLNLLLQHGLITKEADIIDAEVIEEDVQELEEGE